MLILVLALVVWIAGAVVATPAQLRRRMEAKVCKKCGSASTSASAHDSHYSYPLIPVTWIPRGERRARTTGDAWAAFMFMLLWPAFAVFYSVYGVGWLVSRALGKPVLAGTRLTPGELRRIEREQAERIAEQKREIERLTDEIHGATDPEPEPEPEPKEWTAEPAPRSDLMDAYRAGLITRAELERRRQRAQRLRLGRDPYFDSGWIPGR